jgi:hypothetical protein
MIQARHENGYYKGDPLYTNDMEMVAAQICEYFNMTLGTLMSKNRKREIIIARQTAMYFCKENELGSLKSIGQFFGGRDHSTVIHALQCVEDSCFTDRIYKERVEEIRKILKEKKDLRFKFFPEANKSTEEVNQNLDILQEQKNWI